jgi:glycine/sarcosine N-methyltransferase
MNEVRDFYDNLADNYQFIFVNWKQSVYRQADYFSNLLTSLGETLFCTILDCTCGIGTQAIALATKDYHVHGTDLSPREIERAKDYAQQFELKYPITFAVADLLSPPANPIEYDVVLSCDNAVAHFHTEEQFSQAVHTMLMQLKTGGLLMISLRDYDELVKNPPRTTPLSVTDGDDGRRIVFQVWDWTQDLSSYHLQLFILRQDSASWKTEMYQSHLRAWQRTDIDRILEAAGVKDIRWHMPETDGYYQPILTGRKS